MKTQTFFFAVILCALFTFLWEMHWRNQGFKPYHDDSNDLWATWRRQVPSLKADDVLIIGSSRAHFDIDIYVWEELTGKRPIMLASGGMSPGPVLKDLAENTGFKSILIVGVAPDLFFGLPGSGGWNRPQERLDYFKKQTYAQRFSQWVFTFVDPHFAYINDNIQLKALTDWVPMPQRDSVRPPLIWPDMSVNDANRNLKMIPEMAIDTVMQNDYKNIWNSFGWQKPDSTKRDTVIEMYAAWVKQIEARGGKVVFLRAPSTDVYLNYENEAFPRTKYWDKLLEKSACSGIYFEDYPSLSEFNCPEWSHLLPDDARKFTRSFVAILLEEKHLKPRN